MEPSEAHRETVVAQERRTRLHRRVVYVVVLIGLTLPIVVAAIRNSTRLTPAAGDQAIIEMQVHDIPAHLPLVGVYSRLGFHHPGPMLYYLFAIPMRVLGPYGMNLTAAALAIASVAGLLVVFHRRGGQVLFALGVVFCAVLISSMGLDLLSAWNPFILILPFALAVALAWSVVCGDWSVLPWLVLVGSFVVQAHLGLVLPISFLLLSAMAGSLWTLHRNRRLHPLDTQRYESDDPPPTSIPSRRIVMVATVVAFVVWLPPLIDQLTGHPGNVSRIIEVARSGSEGAGLGVHRALDLVGLVMVRVDPVRFNQTSDLRILEVITGGPTLWWVLPVLALLGVTVMATRRRLLDQRRLDLLMLGLVVMAVMAAATITGLPYLYLVRWMVVISSFVWLALIWTILGVMLPDLARRSLMPTRSRGSIPLGVLGVFLLLAFSLVPLATTPGSTNDMRSSAVLEQLIAPVTSSVTGCGLTVVEPTSDPLTLQLVSGVVAALRATGVDAVVGDEFSFPHGTQHSLRGRQPDCTLVIGGPTQGGGGGAAEASHVVTTRPVMVDGQLTPVFTVTLLRAAPNGEAPP